MSVKSFIAGAITIALPVALVAGVMHYTQDYPVIVRAPPLPRPIIVVKHCGKPAPVKRHWGAVDDTADN